jgi:sugar fermentation stimulation protein A
MGLIEKRGLVYGTILKRYQRFLADVRLDDGSVVTAHCTNTGTMKSCWEPGDPVLLEPNDNPQRKLKYTWIACRRDGHWVGVETGIPNRVVAEAARRDRLPGLMGLHEVRTEVKYGQEHSRIDVLAMDAEDRLVYIEVKNTTLRIGERVCFPDAVTQRGTKHLRELQAMVREGHRAAIAFFIHRDDVRFFGAAREIDPVYAEELDRAAAAEVLVLPLRAQMRIEPAVDGTWNAGWSLQGLLPWSGSHPAH